MKSKLKYIHVKVPAAQVEEAKTNPSAIFEEQTDLTASKKIRLVKVYDDAVGATFIFELDPSDLSRADQTKFSLGNKGRNEAPMDPMETPVPLG
jgi:hypothetical protein